MLKNILNLLSIVCILAFLEGCSNSKPQSDINKVKDEISKSIELDKKSKSSVNSILPENTFYKEPDTTGSISSIVVEAPNPVLKEIDHPFADARQPNDDSLVGLSVMDKRFTDSHIYITLLLRNFSTSSPSRRLHILGYDKNNRLISTTNKRIYFQPREQYMLVYNFKKADDITRWIFDLR
ncbi:MAG: hypothetical protein ACYTFY_05885 [Planctomycetota bacterium]|jgi:hypothetical protein